MKRRTYSHIFLRVQKHWHRMLVAFIQRFLEKLIFSSTLEQI